MLWQTEGEAGFPQGVYIIFGPNRRRRGAGKEAYVELFGEKVGMMNR